MKKICMLAIGKLKTSYWQQAEEHYKKQLQRAYTLDERYLKDAQSSLPVVGRIEEEGKRIVQSLPNNCIPICLDEHGKSVTSVQFAHLLADMFDNGVFFPCFIIGGAFGLSQDVLKAAKHTICLGQMTLPHELARVVLWEQLYRADCINRGSPYHHQ